MKPPRTGNCSVPEFQPSQPLVSMSRLREIFKSDNKSSAVNEIKEKLNVVINQKDTDFSDFTNASDHFYGLPPVVECLKYFIAGQVCQSLKKFTKCEVCRYGFFFSQETLEQIPAYPIARIMTLNQEHQFEMQHPNRRFFNFLTKIETSFAKHFSRSNAFELVVTNITEEQLEHPCLKHGCDVYADLVTHYLQNRKRQFAKTTMADVRKANAETKKNSKTH